MGEQQGACPCHAFRQIASNAANQQPCLASAALDSIYAKAVQLLHCHAADECRQSSSGDYDPASVQQPTSHVF